MFRALNQPSFDENSSQRVRSPRTPLSQSVRRFYHRGFVREPEAAELTRIYRLPRRSVRSDSSCYII